MEASEEDFREKIAVGWQFRNFRMMGLRFLIDASYYFCRF